MAEKDISVTLRVSSDAKAYVDRVALEEGRTASDVMRRFMAAGAALHAAEREAVQREIDYVKSPEYATEIARRQPLDIRQKEQK